MPLRKRLMRDEPLPQVTALKQGHTKHSARASKKRNERFSIQGLRAPQGPRRNREGPVP